MNAKKKGSRNEYKAKKLLERMGYELVVKSGASLGLFDLVAMGIERDHALLVQVKSNRKPGTEEMDRLKSFQCPAFCRKEIWIFHDYQREPEIIQLS